MGQFKLFLGACALVFLVANSVNAADNADSQGGSESQSSGSSSSSSSTCTKTDTPTPTSSKASEICASNTISYHSNGKFNSCTLKTNFSVRDPRIAECKYLSCTAGSVLNYFTSGKLGWCYHEASKDPYVMGANGTHKAAKCKGGDFIFSSSSDVVSQCILYADYSFPTVNGKILYCKAGKKFVLDLKGNPSCCLAKDYSGCKAGKWAYPNSDGYYYCSSTCP